ncbi:MAG: c-type cytochrome [Roseiflexus sp.]|nr:c-type cytochrome [Roseiflexus sp.]MCS7289007.1 c-type cytochrome [Roseiflexus sp.]MDW8146663.1 c-type cytochrome [Roseiflexaceae bacterium]MDW8234158.1 c-type cytochrome [Roseiflexaceae bacterium]
MRYRHVADILLLWLALLAGCGVVANRTTLDTPVPTPAASPVAQQAGDPQRGAALFAGDIKIDGFVACRSCHAVDPAASDGLGPNLAGIALRAGSRIPGVAADAYIRRSIQVHDDFVVPGFEAGLARAVVGRDFGEILSDQDIADLTAYLLTLDQAPVAQASTPDPSPSPPISPATTSFPTAIAGGASPSTSTAKVELSLAASLSSTLAPSPSPDNRTLATVSPTIAATETRSAPATPSATAASPTVPPSPTGAATPSATAASPTIPPSPTDAATPSPAPTPTQPPAPTATPAPAASNPPNPGSDEPVSRELAVFTGCMTCHDQHPPNVVKMPHVRFPRCSTCHSGSPSRVGCPTCHSMHRIQAPHGGENPNLPCNHCHADR